MGLYSIAVSFAEKMVSPQRFCHSVNVAEAAFSIARKVGVDPDRAYLAGILHDIARDFSPGELILAAREEGIILRKEERACPILLHGKVAARIVQARLGIKDEGVLLAIASHATGRPGWTRLEQVIYVADKVEPGRDYPGVEYLREALDRGDFEGALVESLRATITYVAREEKGLVDPQTVVVFNEISQVKA
ncbi:MAG TPA: HD domain-containing protein [Firmicutes bacterium]|nr:HD domain-containing protein [Candidatus Fermentithermobacillaceae bacterium]